MDQGAVDRPVILVIKAPNQRYEDQTVSCYRDWTVERLKAHLSDVYPGKPRSEEQRLVYSGKLLLDHAALKDVLRKDEYHMLHLVCASRTPPSSPKTPRSHGNKPQENRHFQSSSSPSAGQQIRPPTGGGGDGLRQRAGPAPAPQAYAHLMHSWNRYSHLAPPTTTTPPHYNPLTLMWWQQLHARQYYMHYQALAASCQHQTPGPPSVQPVPVDPLSQRPHGGRGNHEVQMNVQGGEVLDEEELNRDWLDWVYTFSRASVLLSLVYFYSSFSRFVMVTMAMLVLYLHQAGWFPFNLENEPQLPGDAANQEAEGEPANQDAREMEGTMDDSSDDDDGDSGEEGAEHPTGAAHAGFLSSTWSFLVTFFTSLIPEVPTE
ncbi:homocysteine-responsive endoplasmic reticulum-resident ubiquitin-like domain member 2 protein isoform X2 [Brachionichthys hirsutus]|uniref:homocysteine-responsive endoplasmic reticulum-resident ubiquitin-like domain member 2 protein isoform X2 n=1 Tax=Brachionichthys hirsutus TaxID=412623 RepID=UPI00360501E7